MNFINNKGAARIMWLVVATSIGLFFGAGIQAEVSPNTTPEEIINFLHCCGMGSGDYQELTPIAEADVLTGMYRAIEKRLVRLFNKKNLQLDQLPTEFVGLYGWSELWDRYNNTAYVYAQFEKRFIEYQRALYCYSYQERAEAPCIFYANNKENIDKYLRAYALFDVVSCGALMPCE